MHIHNPHLTQVENRLTGQSFPILEVVKKLHSIRVSARAPGRISRQGEVHAEIEYSLGEEDHFCQKRRGGTQTWAERGGAKEGTGMNKVV